jgi:hypothetical protein
LKKLSKAGNRYFYLLFCISLGLTWYFHKDATRFTDPGELKSDRAGYYIYLPAAFFYHFDTRKMPPDLDMQTGGGFSIDTLNNKISTKYTYGVALLASPFFIASGLLSRLAGYHSESGFSMIYMRMMNLSAVIYLILGLWFLKRFLDHYFREMVSFFVITLVFFGTNLFYYSLIDGMMSHVYSFFLFSLFLFALKKCGPNFRPNRYFILLCISLSLAILIRPTNILLGLLIFTWDSKSLTESLQRVRQFLKPSCLLWFLAILFVIFLPQLVYYKYLTGHWLFYSYGDESFVNWNHPKIAEVLLSPVNGLFTHTPLALFFIAGIVMMLRQRRSNGWLIATVFIVVTLLCASWKMWYFGCSYGQRSYIEYYAILAVPLAWVITGLFNNRYLLVKTIVLFLVFLMLYVNLRYTVSLYRFDRCYYGSTWDWDHYRRSLERAGIISPVQRIGSYQNDFENLALCPVVHPSKIFTRSGDYSIPASDKSRQTPIFSINMDEIGYPPPKMMETEAWLLKPGNRSTGAFLGYTLSRGAEVLFSDEQPADSVLNNRLTWTKVYKTFIIPDVSDSNLQIRVFIRNPRAAPLFVDDLRIKFHYRWN